MSNTYTDVVKHTPIGHTEANNVSCKINGEMACVPMDNDNVHWQEIQQGINDGTITVQNVDSA